MKKRVIFPPAILFVICMMLTSCHQGTNDYSRISYLDILPGTLIEDMISEYHIDDSLHGCYNYYKSFDELNKVYYYRFDAHTEEFTIWMYEITTDEYGNVLDSRAERGMRLSTSKEESEGLHQQTLKKLSSRFGEPTKKEKKSRFEDTLEWETEWEKDDVIVRLDYIEDDVADFSLVEISYTCEAALSHVWTIDEPLGELFED